jgi:hypothetical protein
MELIAAMLRCDCGRIYTTNMIKSHCVCGLKFRVLLYRGYYGKEEPFKKE